MQEQELDQTPTTLLLIRHGNTFDSGDTVTRVGKKTDLPLSKSGIEQAKDLGEYLRTCNYQPCHVFVSTLKRTQQTAQILLQTAQLDVPISIRDQFDEIDYGPDENRPEDEVIKRIGPEALEAWEKYGVPPIGWLVNPEDIKQRWNQFLQFLAKDYENQCVMIVTSNGIARFAPECLVDFENWQQHHHPKMKTGSLSIFTNEAQGWMCKTWNQRP